MKRYGRVQKTLFQEVLLEYKCDGCGKDNKETGGLIPVAIEVNYGEEFGSRDEYDYCNDCLISYASSLVSVGSTSELVTGNDGNS